MIAVTVVVPTYRSTAHLDELVASLDAQTLPQDEFEVLLVDDGSPDDTFARLERFAAERPNYRALRLAHSGWPSRPRNHGIDQARGEYVVFVDHDDRLFPDALRAACALAAHTHADVLDGKESKSDTPGWAMRDLVDDVDNAIDWIDPHPLLPMNPHKMFRTAFLREKGIRFPEGGRQIWEDIHFDIAAHARAEVVSLLVRTPFYYWNRPEHATTSGTFHDDLDEYLDAVARVFRWIDDELDQPRFAELLPRFRAYQLHMRLLPLFRWQGRTPAERERICTFAAWLLTTIPTDADRHLDPWRRIKTALLRAGRFDLVDAHEQTFPMLSCEPTTGAPQWSADGLHLDVGLVWRFARAQQAGEDAATVRRAGDRAVLALNPAVSDFAREHGLPVDVTETVRDVTYALDRRSRTQKIDWLLGHDAGAELSAARPRPDGRDGRPAVSDDAAELSAHLTAAWSLLDDGPGRLHAGPWDLHVRTSTMRTRVVRQLRTTWTGRSWAIVHGRLAAAYRTQNGALSVDVGQTLFSVVDDPRTRAVAAREGDRVRLTIELPHVVAHSALELPGRLVDERGRTVASCLLRAADGRAQVIATVPARAATLTVVFDATTSRTRLRVLRGGRVRLVRIPTAAPRWSARRVAHGAWRRLPAGVRRRVRGWRHR